MTTKTQRLINWFFWNTATVGLAVAGFFFGQPMALNGLKFISWLCFVPLILMTFLGKWEECKETAQNKGAPVPPALTACLDSSIAILCAMNAMWFYAAIFGLGMALNFQLYQTEDEKKEEKPKPESPESFDSSLPSPISTLIEYEIEARERSNGKKGN